MSVALDAESLQHDYSGVTALRGVSVAVPPGELLAVVGESGSGKTTLLRSFNRMVEPRLGIVRVGGEDVRSIPAESLRRRLGYVPQMGGLLPHWTIRRNVALVPRLIGAAAPETAADEALELVGLDPGEHGARYPHELSGGQRQRAALARALAARQEVVLLDEPFGALDAISRAEVHDAFVRVRRELRFTAILVTHDLSEAARLADAVAVMRHGLHRTGRHGTRAPRSAGDAVRCDAARAGDGHGIGAGVGVRRAPVAGPPRRGIAARRPRRVARCCLLFAAAGLFSPRLARAQPGAAPDGATNRAPVVVASKPFGESYLLAEMFAQVLEAPGIAVTRRPGLGATEIAFSALRSGAIDVYPEYTGTGLLAVLRDSVTDAMRRDPRLAFDRVAREFPPRFGVRWLPPLGFQNGYAIAVRRETAERLQLRTLSDVATAWPDADRRLHLRLHRARRRPRRALGAHTG